MLKKIYGNVIPNYRINLGTLPEDYLDRYFYNSLHTIYTSLQSYRGFHEFVKTHYLFMDYYLPKQHLIVEFDESQHFTEARKKALENYPDSLKTGFSTEKWIKLCEKLKMQDNDPPYRDEQRAWYDTLRDFLSEIDGYFTVRLYAGDMVWCNFNPENEEDVRKFREIIEEKANGIL